MTFISRYRFKLKSCFSPAVVALLLAAIINGWLLFLGPIHGLADNGTFYQVLAHNGLYQLPSSHSPYTDFVIPKFGIRQYFNDNPIADHTSQNGFIQIALGLNRLFYSSHYFDIRFMGLTYTLFYLGAIFLLVQALVYPHRQKKSYFIACLTVLIFSDAGFVLYFNAFYPNAGEQIALMYATAALLGLARKIRQRIWGQLLCFALSVLYLLMAQPQNALWALPLCLMPLGCFFLRRTSTRKLIWPILTGLFLMTAALNIALVPKNTRQAAQFQAFTQGTLTHVTDPTATLKGTGVNPQYALMRHQNYGTQDAAEDARAAKTVTEKVTPRWQLAYYRSHPHQFMALLNTASKDIMTIQDRSVGDYTRAAGQKPKAQFKAFTLFSSFMGAFFPGRFAFILLLSLVLIATFTIGAYFDWLKKEPGGIIRFTLVVGLTLLFALIPVTALIYQGDTNLVQNLGLAPVSLALVLLILLSDAGHRRLWHPEGRLSHV